MSTSQGPERDDDHEPPGPKEIRRALPGIEALTDEQGGVVSRSQLITLGLTPDAIDGWRDQKLLVPAARWVYSLCGTRVGPLGDRWAATLSVRNQACVTGDASIDGHGLVAAPPGPVDVLLPSGNPRPQPGIVVHRTCSLPASDVVEIDGLRYASVARTIFDRSPDLTADRLDRVLDRAVHLGKFDASAFDRLARDWPNHGGVTAMRAAIARLNATSGRNRTELERLLIKLILESDMPTPAVNARIEGYEVDISYPGTRALMEADGLPFHTSPAQIARDTERRLRLEAAGYHVRRFDWNAVVYRPLETLREAERFRLANLAPPVPLQARRAS